MPKDGGYDASKKPADTAADGTSQSKALAVPCSGRDLGGGSGTTWPTLTRTNYNSWSLLMKVILQVRHLWDIIETGEGDYDDYRMALEAILWAVPPEMIPMLAVKATAKKEWDVIKTIRVGADRVRDSKAKNFRKQYEDLRFKSGESVDDFGLRLQELVHQLDVHSDPIDDKKVILKYMWIVPKKMNTETMFCAVLNLLLFAFHSSFYSTKKTNSLWRSPQSLLIHAIPRLGSSARPSYRLGHARTTRRRPD
jgi:hypothetical protein